MCSCFAHATWEWELASIIISLLDCSRPSMKQIWTTGHSCEPALKYRFSSMQGFSGHVTIYIEIQISVKLYSWHPIAGWRIKIQSITIDQSTIVYITVGVALRIRPWKISLFTIYVSPWNWPQLDSSRSHFQTQCKLPRARVPGRRSGGVPQGRHGGGNATGRGEHDEDWTWATCAQVRSQPQMSFGGAAWYPADGEI
jgi:hypothetical protein